jgi:hypothetical protein
MSGMVDIRTDKVIVLLKKKRNLPAILSAMAQSKKMKLVLLGKRKLIFEGATFS